LTDLLFFPVVFLLLVRHSLCFSPCLYPNTATAKCLPTAVSNLLLKKSVACPHWTDGRQEITSIRT
jgi:hypothetical protein